MKRLAVTFLAALVVLGASLFRPTDENLVILTRNARGYPEREEAYTEWFHEQVSGLGTDVLCVQEIANQDRVDSLLSKDEVLAMAAFLNSSDGQDNAIFATEEISLEDIEDPQGFQHPAQAAYVAHEGFDAVIVTVHLSWTDTTKRALEKFLLKAVVSSSLELDPDVMIVGDFNTKPKAMLALADTLGMVLMIPDNPDTVGTTHSRAKNRYDHFLLSPDLANEEAVTC